MEEVAYAEHPSSAYEKLTCDISSHETILNALKPLFEAENRVVRKVKYECPDGAFCASSSGLPVRNASGLVRIMVWTDEKATSTLSASKVTARQWTDIKSKLKLQDNKKSALFAPGIEQTYDWGSAMESAQMEKVKEWWEERIDFPRSKPVLQTVTGLLFVTPALSRLGCALQGKSEHAIIDPLNWRLKEYIAGIMLAFEYKKEIAPEHLRQAKIELLLLAHVSEHPPLVLLTDLNSNWTFLCFDEPTVIHELTCNSVYALSVVQTLVNNYASTDDIRQLVTAESRKRKPLSLPDASSSVVMKRIKPPPQDLVDDDIARLEDLAEFDVDLKGADVGSRWPADLV